MSKVRFIDTTIRDGQQSLWALNMTTGMMLPAIEHLDRAGFEAIEFFVPVIQFKKMIRDLNEDPFQWLKLGAPKFKNTQLRLHGGYGTGITTITIPESVRKLQIKIAVDYGVNVCRTSNFWNDFIRFKPEVDENRKMGMETIVNFIYSESPRHTDEYYVSRAKDAAAIKPLGICFKDVGGILTPDRIRELVPKIQEAVGDTPLEFHGHCNNSLGPLNILEIVKQGITLVGTAIPPLANGTSQPSIYNVAENLLALGYDPDINVESLKPVTEHFNYVAKRENFPVGLPLEYDARLYTHQIPGGMISNLRHQLKQVGMEHRLEETLQETAQVRADLGYPIMITPLSQFVGSQAGINVVTGKRYEVVTDDIIHYALGNWGEEAVEVMDKDVRAKILNRPRGEELLKWEAPNMSLEEVRKKYGKHLTDEELLLLFYVGEDALDIARKAPTPKPYITFQQPLVQLLTELTRKENRGYISIQKAGFSLKLGTIPDS
jgi:oxaloacetate decarboxylase alpha subunit